MHSTSLLKPGYRFVVSHTLWKAFSLFNQGAFQFGIVLQLGRDTSHVPIGLDYPGGGRLERDQDLEGRSDQLAKQSLAILQVWGHCLT